MKCVGILHQLDTTPATAALPTTATAMVKDLAWAKLVLEIKDSAWTPGAAGLIARLTENAALSSVLIYF